MVRFEKYVLYFVASVLVFVPLLYWTAPSVLVRGLGTLRQVAVFAIEICHGLGTHERMLLTTGDGTLLFPTEVARVDTRAPYSGAIYGTFFNDSLASNCVEWKGDFKNGRRHGIFEIYKACDAGPIFKFVFSDGTLVEKRDLTQGGTDRPELAGRSP